MSQLSFRHLNGDWNAEPNAPALNIAVAGSSLRLSFYLNPYAYQAEEGEIGTLTFLDCSRWRLDNTNDEAWYAGRGRFAGQAPKWGEFYEVSGGQQSSVDDWEVIALDDAKARHFLFYFRDETVECIAHDWYLERYSPHEAKTA